MRYGGLYARAAQILVKHPHTMYDCFILYTVYYVFGCVGPPVHTIPVNIVALHIRFLPPAPHREKLFTVNIWHIWFLISVLEDLDTPDHISKSGTISLKIRHLSLCLRATFLQCWMFRHCSSGACFPSLTGNHSSAGCFKHCSSEHAFLAPTGSPSNEDA